MVTAEELTVAITSTGVGETREDLEGMEGAMEDTAESASGAAEDLEGFSQRIQGAMSAALAGVAVAVGGLLNQIPVLSEVAAGLGAVFSAIGLQISQLLRDLGAGGLVGGLFKAANVIMEFEGAAADLAGVLGIIGTAIAGAIAGVVGYAASVAVVTRNAAAFVGTLKAVGAAIAGVVTTTAAITAALAVAAAAIIGFAAAYLTNFRGVRDTTNRIIGQIIDFVVGGFTDLATDAVNAVSGLVSDVAGFFTDLASDLADWAGDIASDAREWGVSIIQSMIDGMVSLAESIAEAVQSVINGMIDVINTALDQLPDEVTSRVGVEQFERVDFSSDFGTGGGGGGGGNGRRGGAARVRGQGGTVRLDGRDVSEDTGRYRADPALRRNI